MSENIKLREALRHAAATSGMFEGLSPQEEAFVRVFVERDSPCLALRAADLQDPRYPMRYLVQKLCGKASVKRAILAYRKFVAQRPPKVISFESLMLDLSEIHELAIQRGDTKVALEVKKTQIALALGKQDASERGSKP